MQVTGASSSISRFLYSRMERARTSKPSASNVTTDMERNPRVEGRVTTVGTKTLRVEAPEIGEEDVIS